MLTSKRPERQGYPIMEKYVVAIKLDQQFFYSSVNSSPALCYTSPLITMIPE
jgi:hypothetical protein